MVTNGWGNPRKYHWGFHMELAPETVFVCGVFVYSGSFLRISMGNFALLRRTQSRPTLAVPRTRLPWLRYCLICSLLRPWSAPFGIRPSAQYFLTNETFTPHLSAKAGLSLWVLQKRRRSVNSSVVWKWCQISALPWQNARISAIWANRISPEYSNALPVNLRCSLCWVFASTGRRNYWILPINPSRR